MGHGSKVTKMHKCSTLLD